MYHVEFSEGAFKQLQKLDKGVVRFLLAWIEKHLEGTDHPRQWGKGLSHERKGIWRYRVGDYRILANIEDHRLVILVVEVGHRRSIYER